MSQRPQVSVIIPAYYSDETLIPSLSTMVKQDYEPLEIVVVDSTPDAPSADRIAVSFPGVIYHHSAERLFPHEARNVGASLSQGALLLFTDPDIYAIENWITMLVDAHLKAGHFVCGGLDCYGSKWVHRGMHYSKFDQWLPGGRGRWIEIGPTYGLLCPRTAYYALGGFGSQPMLADADFSWRASEAGYRVWFEPEAMLEHHHLGSWGELIRSMSMRGREYARLRLAQVAWTRGRILLHLLLTLSGLRLAGLCLRILRNTIRAGQAHWFVWTLPIIVSAQGAWLLGEAVIYWRSSLGAPQTAS